MNGHEYVLLEAGCGHGAAPPSWTRIILNRPASEQAAIRQDAFRWLDDSKNGGVFEFSRDALTAYSYGGTRIPLVDTGRGIRNPADFDATLSLLTTAKAEKYDDVVEPDGTVRYAYQNATDGDNVKLREAIRAQVPLVYFQGVRPGYYVAHYPLRAVAESRNDRVVLLLAEELFRFDQEQAELPALGRRYVERQVKQRLHQPLFRAQVLNAYETSCAVCGIRQSQLLDAAHIIPDAEDEGRPEISNGLALCKLHHAAYDSNLLGIRPDLTILVAETIRSGGNPVQDAAFARLSGEKIWAPRGSSRPSVRALGLRFEQFLASNSR